MRGLQLVTKVFHCPDLHDQADVQDIQDMLSNAPGVEEAHVDWVRKEVRIRLSNPEAEDDVRLRLSEAGYPAAEEE